MGIENTLMMLNNEYKQTVFNFWSLSFFENSQWENYAEPCTMTPNIQYQLNAKRGHKPILTW
jgi:hypothetical protein